MEKILTFLHDDPISSFALLLAITLTVPPLFERIRLPGVLGLLAAGLVVGPNGLGVLVPDSPVMELLADVGLLYLMFVAGLEIDLAQLRKVKYRSAGFGAFTFFCPLITGTLIGRWFQFDWNGSLLLGSLLASHSLMTYPIVRRLGVVANEAVTVTIGATIITDISALIVLAICLGVHAGGFSAAKLLTLLLMLSLYTTIVLVGIDRLGRDFFRRSGSDEGNQFLFVLLAVFLAALGAQLIGVEKIVGAFLSGLAVNDVVRDGPVKEKLVFVGSVLFIPIFFVNIGLLIDLPAFISSLSAFWLAIAIVSGLIGSKLLAAFLAKVSFRYSWREMTTMWAMSTPQVATTLAATLVGNRVGLLSDSVLNSVVVMMLVTATVGPLIVSRSAVGLPLPAPQVDEEDLEFTPEANYPGGFTVVVPIYNPRTEQDLIELAALLAQKQAGKIVPLAITLARPHMNRAQLARAMSRSQDLLVNAEQFGQQFKVQVNPLLRIDDQVPLGIYRASLEQHASLIVMGGSNTSTLRARLFGTIVDSVFAAAPCPVAVAQLKQSPSQIRQILVPVENFSERSLRMVIFARLLTEGMQAAMTLIHMTNPALGDAVVAWAMAEMKGLARQASLPATVRLCVLPADDLVQAIAHQAQHVDLVVLHSQRSQTAAEGFGFSSITSQVLKHIECSTIVLGEHHWEES